MILFVLEVAADVSAAHPVRGEFVIGVPGLHVPGVEVLEFSFPQPRIQSAMQRAIVAEVRVGERKEYWYHL